MNLYNIYEGAYNVYSCGCYINGTCALTKKIANCVYYEICTTGGTPPKLIMDDEEGCITNKV